MLFLAAGRPPPSARSGRGRPLPGGGWLAASLAASSSSGRGRDTSRARMAALSVTFMGSVSHTAPDPKEPLPDPNP